MAGYGGDHHSPEARERDAKRREEIRTLFMELKDPDRVAAQAGVDRRTVLRHTRDLRNARTHIRYPQETWDAIEKFLREEQAPYKAASEIFGPSKEAIAKHFPELGWRREQAGRHQGQINALMWKLGRAVYANAGK